MIVARLAALALAAAAAGAAAGAAAVDSMLLSEARALGDTGPAIAALAASDPPRAGLLRLRDGTPVGRLRAPGDAPARLRTVPALAAAAFVAAEDKTFWTNPGVDPAAMARSAARDAASLGRRRSGASTITQQLAKIALMGGDSSTPRRKARQVVLALRIAAALPKDEVMRLYLERVYLGMGATGLAEASEAWFGKPPEGLTLAEAAALAGAARSPARNDPGRDPAAARARRDAVLAAMARLGSASPGEAAAAAASPLGLAPPHPRAAAVDPGASPGVGWLVDRAREEVARSGPPGGGDAVLAGSAPLQAAAEAALQAGLMRWEARSAGWRGTLSRGAGPDRASGPAPGDAGRLDAAGDGASEGSWHPAWARPALVLSAGPAGVELWDRAGRWRAPPSALAWLPGGGRRGGPRAGDVVLAGRSGGGRIAQPTSLQGAVAAVDAADGSVLAEVGGGAWTPGGLDRASSSARQPGSAFKPFVYLAALMRGYRPDTAVFDLPVAVDDGTAGGWRPSDDDGRFLGAMALSRALAESRNAPVVRLMAQLGTADVGDLAAAFGIYPSLRSPASALGAQEATVLAIASAYATLAAGGARSAPRFTAGGAASRVQVADPGAVAALGGMLRGVVGRGGTAGALAPFAARMAARGMPVSGKTGTSQGFADAWMAGYAGGVAVAVRIGYDRPRAMGPDAFGAAVAGPVLAEVLEAAAGLGLASPGHGSGEAGHEGGDGRADGR